MVAKYQDYSVDLDNEFSTTDTFATVIHQMWRLHHYGCQALCML